MAAQVGEIPCTYVKGASSSGQSRVKVWRTPGMQGYGAQLVGSGENSFRFEVVLYAAEHYVETWFAAVEALRGTIVTIVDDYNQGHANCLIMDTGTRAKIPRVGGSIGRLMLTGVKLA